MKKNLCILIALNTIATINGMAQSCLQEIAAAEILGLFAAAKTIYPEISQSQTLQAVYARVSELAQSKNTAFNAALTAAKERAEENARNKYCGFARILALQHQEPARKDLYNIICGDIQRRANQLPKLATYDQFINGTFTVKSNL